MVKRSNKVVQTPLEKAESQIKVCAIFAYISAGLTVVLAAIVLAGGSPELAFYDSGDAIFVIAEALVIAGLGFGVSKKNRVCAILLLAIFCIDKIAQIALSGLTAATIVFIVIWAAIYWGGVQGTFAYKKLKDAELSMGITEDSSYAMAEQSSLEAEN